MAMKAQNNRLIIKQLDKRFQPIHALHEMEPPKEGWVRAIRKALNMSLRQLGERLSITPQGVKKIEQSEGHGGITLNALREVGDALDLQLVYAFIPKAGSLEKIIEKQAEAIARKIVMRTSTTMKLEDQENSNQRIKEAIADLTEELKKEMPRTLWD